MSILRKGEVNDIDKIKKAVDFINSRIVFSSAIAVVLGTGLGGFADRMEIIKEIEYSEIPFFPVSTVTGHKGKLIFGTIGSKNIILLSGRFHVYEGYSMHQIAFPIQVLSFLGVKTLLLSNMAGGLISGMKAGDMYLIKDHINFMHGNPLIGYNDLRLGPRFPDMKAAYDIKLRKMAFDAAKKIDLHLGSAVYAAMTGPNLETPAEYNMLHILGAGLVGMSTVPEVIAARHLGMAVLAISVVSNVCFPIEEIKTTTLESVLKVADIAGPQLSHLFEEVIKKIE